MPCEGTSDNLRGNLVLLDVNGDAKFDLSDAIYPLAYLFVDGPRPVLGTGCILIPGGPNACVPAD